VAAASAAAGACAAYFWLRSSKPAAGAGAATPPVIVSSRAEKGKVYLVGAGPGGVGLMTVRAYELLKQAEVLVMDELSDAEISALAPSGCEVIVVGKRGGKASSVPQADINEILVAHGRKDRVVVRMKGGDPLVYGRVQQEMVALRAAGIPFELVPGVTSALSAPAAAGIPVTDKVLGTAFAVLSGHDPSKVNWNGLSKIDTLVILMGTRKLGVILANLRAEGLSGETPVCIVQWANTPKQLVLKATVDTIEATVGDRKLSPAIIIIGKVVGLAV